MRLLTLQSQSRATGKRIYSTHTHLPLMMMYFLCMFAVSLLPSALLALVDQLACFLNVSFSVSLFACVTRTSSSDINQIAFDCLSKLSNMNMNVTSSQDSLI